MFESPVISPVGTAPPSFRSTDRRYSMTELHLDVPISPKSERASPEVERPPPLRLADPSSPHLHHFSSTPTIVAEPSSSQSPTTSPSRSRPSSPTSSNPSGDDDSPTQREPPPPPPLSRNRTMSELKQQKGAPHASFFVKMMVRPSIGAGLMIILLLFINLCYLCGSLYQQTSKYDALKFLMVDYDRGVIGQSMIVSYQNLKSVQTRSFPTAHIANASDYPTPEDIFQAVRHRNYWAAIFSSPNASVRLQEAFAGGDAAKYYSRNASITYIWNSARYPGLSTSVLRRSSEQIISTSRKAFYAINGTGALSTMAQNNSAALNAFLNPIVSLEIDMQIDGPNTQMLYNTIIMALSIMQQFFMVTALHGIVARLQLSTKLSRVRFGILRFAISLGFTCIGGLVMTGAIWAFRDRWTLSGGQFALTWIILWLLMHIYFCFLDGLSMFLPTPAVSFMVFAFIFMTVTSTISPFEVTPGFYRWSIILPGHNVYDLLTQVWSGGPGVDLGRILGLLFTWWFGSMSLVALGIKQRRPREPTPPRGPPPPPIASRNPSIRAPSIASTRTLPQNLPKIDENEEEQTPANYDTSIPLAVMPSARMAHRISTGPMPLAEEKRTVAITVMAVTDIDPDELVRMGNGTLSFTLKPEDPFDEIQKDNHFDSA